MAARLRVSVTDARGRPLAAARWRALPAWLARAAPRGARGEVSVALVSDAVMRRLNHDFRRVNHATDVLTFPAAPDPGPRGQARRPPKPRPSAQPARRLGDVAIATGVALRQARQMGHPLAVEVRILALHGLLHLLGYDHETDRGEMQRTEERLRRRAGLPAGLIARATRRAGRS